MCCCLMLDSQTELIVVQKKMLVMDSLTMTSNEVDFFKRLKLFRTIIFQTNFFQTKKFFKLKLFRTIIFQTNFFQTKKFFK